MNTTRLIAKVLRELLMTETFVSFADLTDALRARLATLHVRYRPVEFDEAITLVSSNRQAVRSSRPGRTPPAAPLVAPPALTRPEAARLVARLLARR